MVEFGEVLRWNVVLDRMGELGCCCYDVVAWGEGWVGYVFVLKKYCAGDAGGSAVLHPDFPASVVFG